MQLCEGLGYSRLSIHEQQAYKIMLKAFSSFLDSFDVSSVDRDVDLMKVIRVVLGDNPNVVYFDKSQIKTVTSGSKMKVQLVGYISKSKGLKLDSALKAKSEFIISSVCQSCSDEYSKLIAIYEYLQKNVRYDMQEFRKSVKGKSKRSESHNAYGALINGLAVCDGFSSAFVLLSQAFGFECTLVGGRSTHRSMGLVNHAWNLIKVQNRCYHLDVTWDANQFSEFHELSYDYFALCDNEISNDHEWDVGMLPLCVHSDLSFFRRNGLFVTSQDQLKNAFRLSCENRSIPVRVKLAGNIAYSGDMGAHLAKMLIDEAIRMGGSVKINYTWNEYTRCFLALFE